MSTYYDYREVGVMIAHKLMKMDGWNVYGYHADESDPMTDYYSPAHWGGVAEKNGYVFCFNVYGKAEATEIRKYNYGGFTYDKSITEKIEKLKQMTVERGASEAEAESAKLMIARLQKKAEESKENANKYDVIGIIPAHMEHPPRMNWHIEKDGVIIEKGNGVLKYKDVSDYYTYSSYIEDMKKFKTMSKEEYIKEYTFNTMNRWNESQERAAERAESHYKSLIKDAALIEKFEQFINKIDTTCGGLLGEGDGIIYEKVKVVEYKKENRVVEDINGSITEGQCFVVKTNFNYGIRKGYVYRIHETVYEDGKKTYHAYKLNNKKTKECTGMAKSSNYMFLTNDFIKWFEKGSLSWCHIEEVKTPYEVEKVVKKVIKSEKKVKKATESNQINVDSYTYEVTEDTDTRNNEKIYLVKVAEKLSREEYIEVNNYIKSLGGYYSKYKHAFLFKENPGEKLNRTIKEMQSEESQEIEKEDKMQSVSYTITEDTHSQSGNTIWIVKPDMQLSKNDFAEVKRKFATIQGYYSTLKNGFIFKYNPQEKIEIG